jgi:hypothetical protein
VLDDQSSCPRTSPHRLTLAEVRAIGNMVTSPEYRHVPTGTLAVLAQRLGIVSASPSTWYRLVRTYGWRRPRVRVHPAKPRVGLRTTGPDEIWHIDTTVIRLLDGPRAYLHAVIDNFSRHVAETCAPVNSVRGRALHRPKTPKKLLESSGRGMQDLAGVAVHEVEAERCRPLAETTEHASTLLQVVRVCTGISVDEFSLQCAIDQDGELAGGRGKRLGFANTPG